MSSGADTALEVVGVDKRYGGVHALRSVSFSVREGVILGLIGANGAGKSTLLDIIGGEQPADAGDVVMFGQKLTGPVHRRAIAGLGRTFQHPAVSLEMTVYENVAVGLSVRELGSRGRAFAQPIRVLFTGAIPSRRDVGEVCEQVGLHGIDRECSLLSFGELRLLEVARALIQRPKVMLLDEPFPGVEDEGIALLVKVLRELADGGETIVLVDHNISIVEELVDEVVLLARGQVQFVGSVADCVASDAFRDEYVGAGREAHPTEVADG